MDLAKGTSTHSHRTILRKLDLRMVQLHLLLSQSCLCFSMFYTHNLQEIFRQYFGTRNLGFIWAAVRE